MIGTLANAAAECARQNAAALEELFKKFEMLVGLLVGPSKCYGDDISGGEEWASGYIRCNLMCEDG